ncbi:Hpt domain-containing protein [Propionivibrio limicola]|uniref:hybrid sensor histidine kinase/response regulator n=1 Tax=Propionivibrio limicola TaxID=167645 RepID=UPI001290C8D2|nr:Hpt domain-containing protein [Propionivibrio limicola]
MNAATEFDVGPLTWIKGEIGQALARADQSLQQYAASLGGGNDTAQLRFCRTHLHQVVGALRIVGLDGVTEFAVAVESLLEELELDKVAASEPVVALVRRCLTAIGLYLDGLVAGQPNQPLRLSALYLEVQKVRGLERASVGDLFFPDLSVRLPRKPVVSAMPPEERQRVLRQERARFQRGLLSWLRSSGDRSGVGEMHEAVRAIEELQETAPLRTFWFVAAAFLAALAEGALADEVDARQLCSRIDLQIRRLIEGTVNVAERMTRDALYLVAIADSHNDDVECVRNTFGLQALIPVEESSAPSSDEPLLRKLGELISSSEETWGKFCAGTLQALHSFKAEVDLLAATVDQLGQTDFRRLAQAIVAVANWLEADIARHSDALSMEVATAILLAQNARENYQRLGADFAHQVDVTVARIHACMAGNPPAPGAEIALLDEMSRQAQEKLLLGQVAKEMQSNLAQIEQVLDNFFRDPEKRTELDGLNALLNQVVGALSMMRHDGAVAVLRESQAEIKRFAEAEYVPAEADFERVANQLSMLGFFIDSMQYGAVDYESFVRQMQTPPAVGPEESDDETAMTVEQEVARQKVEAHALLGALKDQQDDAALREELKHTVRALKSGADLVADAALGEQAKAILSVLDSGEQALDQIDQAMETLKPVADEAPAPSAETIKIAQSSSEDIDAELLEIFLEEAKEVLATIDENLRVLGTRPHDAEVLTTIRRSFHTLKGSGRMVGLKDVGEVAWAVEQTLNQWLRQEQAVEAPLLDMLGVAHQLFADWVEFLDGHAGSAPDPSRLVALTEALRSGGIGREPAPESAEQRPETAKMPPADFAPESALPETGSEIAELDLAAAGGQMADVSSLPAMGEEVATDESSAVKDTNKSPAPVLDDVYKPQQRITISPVLYEIFSEEAAGHLETLRRELRVLESDESLATPHDMYRAAHTLAGISGTVGLSSINRLGLALEHALLRRDHSEQKSSLEALGVIRQAIGELDLMLSAVPAQRDVEAPFGVIESLEAVYPVSGKVPAQSPEQLALAEAEVRETEPAGGADEELPAADESDSGGAKAETFIASLPTMLDEIDEQLLPIFLEEARDLEHGISTQLGVLRNAPDSSEAVRTLARLLHTLKGSARMAGAMNLGEITHAMETRVEQAARDGYVSEDVLEAIENAFDAVLHIIDRLQRGESVGAESVAAAGITVTSEGASPVPVEPAVTAVGGGAAQSLPATAPVLVERRADRSRFAAAEPESDASAQHATLRVRADLIDRLVNDAGELAIARSRIEGEMRSLKDSLLDLTENVIRLRRQLREIEIQAETQMQSRTAQTEELHAGFDPLEFDRFTRFQELTRMMAESVNDVATVQQGLLKNLDDANAAIVAQARLNRELQQGLMGVRMLPFASLADRLYRVVRQASKELGKRANLEIAGGNVELDRSVLDTIVAPLEHMLRNAVAHGLEDREARLLRGKPEIGDITLTLKQEGNEILLALADDGGGLDFERIRAHALEVGLLSPDETATPERLAELIFAPGFSTAAEISQIAGRGIGMDVVKTEIARLGGRIEIDSVAGTGATFNLYIPLTLAVTKALLVQAGGRCYAIPSTMIEQVLDLKETALSRIREAGSAEWLGHHYPFSYLPHLLGDKHAQPEPRRQYWTLLLRSGVRRISVLVDELLGNEEVVVKNIGPQLARVVGIDGATVLGNGEVVLILNPVALSSRPQPVEAAVSVAQPASQESVAEMESAEVSSLPTVMVVDDSLTVRKVTGRLLAREGYQVITAKDGVEALECLLDTVPDVMLVDIEMPRMDGFDLTRNVRADERLKDIPIIMITSRTADKHRSYAFELGVNHYLGKPYQEEELLKLVAGYVSREATPALVNA